MMNFTSIDEDPQFMFVISKEFPCQNYYDKSTRLTLLNVTVELVEFGVAIPNRLNCQIDDISIKEKECLVKLEEIFCLMDLEFGDPDDLREPINPSVRYRIERFSQTSTEMGVYWSVVDADECEEFLSFDFISRYISE